MESVDYTYGDSGYGDLLTLVGGESIVYDAIGNPTTYRGASLAFTGRRLQSYAKNGTLTSYRYDADGIRTFGWGFVVRVKVPELIGDIYDSWEKVC